MRAGEAADAVAGCGLAALAWLWLAMVLLSTPGCGPHQRPMGPRARPDLHYSSSKPWCPAKSFYGPVQHVTR